jgi:hypothetical protein
VTKDAAQHRSWTFYEVVKLKGKNKFIIRTSKEKSTMKRFMLAAATSTLICFLVSSPSALTVEEVIQLKKEGVSDETIQLMIEQEMLRETLSDPDRNMGVRKVEEPDGRGSTVYSTGTADDRQEVEEESEWEKREKAWEMLDNVIIDTRDSKRKDDRDTRKKE